MSAYEVVADIGAVLGEGPSWDEREGVLYWVDILEKRVYRYDPSGQNMSCCQLDQYVGAVVPRQSGGLAFAGHTGLYSLDFASGTAEHIASPENGDSDLRFNDGKCDPAGRFWAGMTSLTGRSGVSSLYRLDADKRLHPVLDGVSISNGLGWSPDGSVMYYIDTPTLTVAAFDFDMESGSLSNKRVVIEIPESEGHPDGMTVDEEGKLWIAHWGGFQVSRWDPVAGTKLSAIRLPVPLVTSCTFGGADRSELYITTARYGMSEQELAEHPLSGAVFRVKTETVGSRTYAFEG